MGGGGEHCGVSYLTDQLARAKQHGHGHGQGPGMGWNGSMGIGWIYVCSLDDTRGLLCLTWVLSLLSLPFVFAFALRRCLIGNGVL